MYTQVIFLRTGPVRHYTVCWIDNFPLLKAWIHFKILPGSYRAERWALMARERCELVKLTYHHSTEQKSMGVRTVYVSFPTSHGILWRLLSYNLPINLFLLRWLTRWKISFVFSYILLNGSCANYFVDVTTFQNGKPGTQKVENFNISTFLVSELE